MTSPRPTRRPLSARSRRILDAARASAALYVVAHHVVHVPVPYDWLFSFGQEAVVVFFVLSGFVIFNSEIDRTDGPLAYYGRRFWRIYPPLVLSLLLSGVLVWSGLVLETFSWQEVAGTFLGLADRAQLMPGVIVEPFLGNLVLWSLSYELFFYAIFPLLLRGWRANPRLVNHLVGAAGVIGMVSFELHPNHLSLVTGYLLTWWVGAMAAAEYTGVYDPSWRLMRVAVTWLVVVCALLAGLVVVQGWEGTGVYPFLSLRHFGAAVVLVAVARGPVWGVVVRLSPLLAPLAIWVAPISYEIYIFHYPLLVQSSVAGSWPGFAASIIPLLALSWASHLGYQAWTRRQRSRRTASAAAADSRPVAPAL
ncbi:acyltransferase family protein [Nocardioides sp.]|uniref:acyltransferase family protein n=1 Tax=Nocardioides sp. TaxID=35761 RepID=UPI00356ACDBB